MLINLRNALMAGKRLPYDAEVEYLESSGTQYIDTGIDTAIGLSVDTTFAYTAQTLYGILFGVQSPANNFMEVRLKASTTTLTALVKNAVTTMGAVTFNNVNRFVGTWTSTGADLDLNGTTYTSTAGAVAGSANYPLYIFAGNQDNASAYHSKARVYSFKITDAQGNFVRDYIPVRKGTVGYLYDRVSGKLFGNAGTGDFVLGPDVVPVEYILQTGTQYIDTLYPMADTRREVVTVDWSGHSTTYREFMAGAASGSYLIEMSPTGYYGTAPTNLSSIQVSQKDRIRWDYTVGSRPSLYINDVFAINDKLVRVPTGNVMTGGVGIPGQNFPKMKIYGIDIFADADEQVRKMLSVRVGTEGAMMDVLTRRIYRNAGTGAFGYGNDLKYPIPAS